MKNLTLLCLFIALMGCKKEYDSKVDKQSLMGRWVNQINSKDTLYFTDTFIYRGSSPIVADSYCHSYSYELKNDNLSLVYLGMDKVYFIKPFNHFLVLNSSKDTLSIQNFQGCYPAYKGDNFIKINN